MDKCYSILRGGVENLWLALIRLSYSIIRPKSMSLDSIFRERHENSLYDIRAVRSTVSKE
jgi:hypothetical protein